MTILDSVVFASSSGGQMANKYVSGMSVTNLDTVRSAIDGLTYVRTSTSPASLVITSDPALLSTHFVLDDPSTPVGSIRSFPDNESTTKPFRSANGQQWLRSGSYALVSQFTRPIPDHLKIYGDHWSHNLTAAQAGFSGSYNVVDVVGDGVGNWLMINANGNVYRSIDDGISWTLLSVVIGNNTKIATNGKGRWWLCSAGGAVYVSTDLGANWVAQVSPNGNRAAVFKFMNNKLVYVPYVSLTISNSSSNVMALVYTLPDTSSTSQAWTVINYNQTSGYPAFASGTTAFFIDGIGNDVDVLYFVAVASSGYVYVSTYNMTTTVWSVGSIGAANYVQGMTYENGYAWFHCSQFSNNSTIMNCYEVLVNPTAGISSVANQMVNGTAPIVNAGSTYAQGAGYLRKSGSTFLMMMAQAATQYRLFRGGFAASAGRAIASGSQNGAVLNVMAMAGETILILGANGLNRSPAVVGLVSARVPASGMIDYIRVQ